MFSDILPKKTKRDVLIADSSSLPNWRVCAATSQFKATILRYKPNMRKLVKRLRILTIAHELGHAAGLDHAKAKASLMYPYVDKTTAKGLSKADVKSLKKARTRANKRNVNRKKFLNLVLKLEQNKISIPISYAKTAGKSWVFSFPKRGTTFKSSNSRVITAMPNGIVTVKGVGDAKLIVHNAGKKYEFCFMIY